MYQGYVLKETYVFDRVIGVGGMGEVWSAKRINLGDKVAIKVLKVSRGKDSDAIREQLQSEAKITSILSHPNICKIYEFTEQEQTCFLVMELLEGLDLQMLLSNRQLLSEVDRIDLAIYISKQILRALEAAHNINHPTITKILHRDIKPSNIFLTKYGEIKLLDLGIAKIETDLDATKSNYNFFSICYSSPELWKNGTYNGSKYSEQNDLYSLGLVFYEILTGEKAYKSLGDNLIEKIENGIIPKLSDNFIPKKIINFFEKWNAWSPVKRYKSAKELLVEIDKLNRDYNLNESVIQNIFKQVHKENSYESAKIISLDVAREEKKGALEKFQKSSKKTLVNKNNLMAQNGFKKSKIQKQNTSEFGEKTYSKHMHKIVYVFSIMAALLILSAFLKN